MAPFSMAAWGGGETSDEWRNNDTTSSVYGLVVDGAATLTRYMEPSASLARDTVTLTLRKGMYFSCPGRCSLSGGAGVAIVAPNRKPISPTTTTTTTTTTTAEMASSRALDAGWAERLSNHKALFSVGGPILDDDCGDGRLPYIDGCSDTLLVAPVVKGAPCLNHLHFPPNIEQTQHTHPSGRAGVVLRGRGRCVVESQGESGVERTVTPLEPGVAFVIPAHLRHAFETTTAAPGEGDETLDVFAFHPDSDFGPAPSDHPMVNRTVVDGVSASLLPEIQTTQTQTQTPVSE